MSCPSEQEPFSSPVVKGQGILLKSSELFPSLEIFLENELSVKKVLFVTTGGMYSEVVKASRALLMEDVLSDIYTLRFIKPLDEKHLADIFAHYDGIIFVEDGIKTGGVSEYLSLVCEKNLIHNYAVKAFPEGFYSQGSREDVLEEAGMSVSDLKNTALDLLK